MPNDARGELTLKNVDIFDSIYPPSLLYALKTTSKLLSFALHNCPRINLHFLDLFYIVFIHIEGFINWGWLHTKCVYANCMSLIGGRWESSKAKTICQTDMQHPQHHPSNLHQQILRFHGPCKQARWNGSRQMIQKMSKNKLSLNDD